MVITMVLHSLACSSEAAMKGDTSFIVYNSTRGCSRSLAAVSQAKKTARIIVSNRNLTRAWWQGSPPGN